MPSKTRLPRFWRRPRYALLTSGETLPPGNWAKRLRVRSAERIFVRTQELHNLRRANVPVIGREQTVGLHFAVFAAHTARLRAIERPVAPAQILFSQVLDKPAKPLAVVTAIERLASAEFTNPQRNSGFRVQQESCARVVGLPQLFIMLESVPRKNVRVRRVHHALRNLQHQRQRSKRGEIGGILRSLDHYEQAGIFSQHGVAAALGSRVPIQPRIEAAPLRSAAQFIAQVSADHPALLFVTAHDGSPVGQPFFLGIFRVVPEPVVIIILAADRKSTRLNSSHEWIS